MNSFLKQPKQLIFKQLSLSISLAIASSLLIVPAHAATSSTEINYQIQKGSLTDALNAVAQRANVTLLLDTNKTNTYQVEALSGQYTVDQALQALLSNTPFQIQKTPAGYIVQEAPASAVQQNNNANSVLTQANQTAENNNNITEQQEIQRIQQEAVQLAPLTVYGEKDRDTQGYDDVYDKNYSTVYAGKDLIERFKGTTPSDLFKGMSNVYSGDARNSGALDPNIRGIQGEGRIPLTIDGTEQSLTVWRGYNGANNRNYIDPNLISSLSVAKGPGIDRDIKTGIGGGVAATTLQVDDIVKPGKKYGAEIKIEGATNTTKEIIPNSYAGQDYRDVIEELGITWDRSAYADPLSAVPVIDKGNDLSNLQDKALRFAVATKQDHFDLLAAYAYRNRGNYFAGNKGSDFYTQDTVIEANQFNFVQWMSDLYLPNHAVTNTSNRMESYLLKGTWRPSDDQALQLTYRDSNTTYGEIMPSRIGWWQFGNGTLPQWQLSEVDTKAYSLDYKYNPQDNRWIDLNLSLWQTDTESHTHTAGGFPHFLKQRDNYFDFNMDLNGDGVIDRTTGDFLIRDTTIANSKNTKKGVTLSNKFNLLDNLNLTLGASLQHEKLTTDDEYYNDGTTGNTTGYRMLPRAGRRAENQYYFNFDWQPISWLSLTAGAKSVSYWSFDDYLNQSSGGSSTISKEVAKKLSYTVDVDNYTQEMYNDEVTNGVFTGCSSCQRRALAAIGTVYTYTRYEYWYADENGKYSAANNPFLNGTIDLNQENVTISSATGDSSIGYTSVIETVTVPVKKKKDHKNWAPAFSAAFQLNPNNRFYINYSEAYRLPSLFETTLGFSSSQSDYDLEPEHAYNWEIAYVYNLKEILKLDKGQADIKLAYFRNKTKNVIERGNLLIFSNVDKQTIAGWELSGHLDNGRYFGDLSLVWNKQNKVCDESSALLISGNNIFYSMPDNCIDYGFQGGYLVNMALPKYQANLTLGTRLLDNKLELGTRVNYFHKFINPYIGTSSNYQFLNAPIAWDSTWLFDAYAHYQYNERLGLDLVGTNLTNKYYLDPLSRSAVPAPGRTFKLALTYNF